ncbi:hypothetical protein REPUB_Repub04eG0072500 [Reevesia pubescens]
MESSTWSRNGKPDAWHFLLAVYFSFGFLVARFFLDKFIFRRLAIWLLSNESAPLKMNEATKAKIVKCSESMWKLAYYATVETCVLKITYYEPWFRDTKGYFRGWPDQELKLPLSLYYMCQCGFYIYSIAALLTWETRRKDFAVMMSHHVITVILIGYSYVTRYPSGKKNIICLLTAFSASVQLSLRYMMEVMCLWKRLKFLNILRGSLVQVCASDYLPSLGSCYV